MLAPTFARAEAGGMWWPYSRDLTREGAHLVDGFPAERGRIDRLVYAPGDWDVVTTEVFTNRGRIRAGYLEPGRRGGLMLVRLVGAGIIPLRVAWPEPRRG